MRMFDNALSILILEHLHKCGMTPRKNLYTPFSSYGYRYYASIVQRLINEGYLEVVRYKELNHVKITPKGEKALLEKYGKKSELNEIKAKDASPKMRKRQMLVSEVIGLCEANGFYTGKGHPPLVHLYGIGDQTEIRESEAEFEEHLTEGIFYSAGEIRLAFIEVVGKNEIANWSRLVGVVLFGHRMTFVYSVGESLIRWMPSCEDRTVSMVQYFLMRSDIIRTHITQDEHPSCIVCGRGMTMIPKIVTGRKWGRISDNKTTETGRAKFARDHINSHNLGKVFGAAYYVTVERHGVSDFRLACMIDEAKKEELCDSWFGSIETATRLKTLPYHQGVSRTRARVIYMPYMDLIELEFYRKQGEPAHFVIPSGTQEAVSRVMGPLLLSARSLKGTILKFNRYDANGASLGKEGHPQGKETESC